MQIFGQHKIDIIELLLSHISNYNVLLINSLDATESSRKGRFANDAAPGDVQCNASVKCLPSKGKPYLALFANRKIGIGEEIRYDYGVPDLPWRKQVL